MKKIIILASIFIQSSMIFAQTPATDPGWELYFDDEFNTGTVPNPDYWFVYDKFDHYQLQHPNGSKCLYITDNAKVNNGNLEIKIKHETVPCYPPYYQTNDNCAYSSYDYTSAYVQSKIDFQYGYVEASIKFPDARIYSFGSLFKSQVNAAFWTTRTRNLPPANYVNSSNEIDVIETNYNDYFYLPMPTNIHIKPDITDQKDCSVPFYPNGYHKFAVEWDPGKIIWYFDDNVVRNSPNPGIIDPVNFIFNIGLDDIPSFFINFPYTMYVDYIKAYKLKDDCSQINTCSYNFVTHNNKVKELINIGGNGCTNAVSSGSNISLLASDYVYLSGDFSVPAGTNFLADVNNNCYGGSLNYHCNYSLHSCNYNFSGYNNEIKTRIELGGTGCSAVVTNGNHVSLKAIQAITLGPGFKADFGSVTEIKIVTCP